jgi:hypothetical protein
MIEHTKHISKKSKRVQELKKSTPAPLPSLPSSEFEETDLA